MSVVVSFTGWTPPARYDDLPWTEVRIEEAATEDGVYAQIDVVALDPLDTDPEDPQARTFTTEDGTVAYQWYRLVWADADGDTSIPSESIQNLDAAAPYASVSELQRILKIRAPTAEQTAAMNRVLGSAAGEINHEIDLADDDGLEGWELMIAAGVNLDRAADLWHHLESKNGITGLLGADEGGIGLPGRYSWERYAQRLAPLKRQWGIA